MEHEKQSHSAGAARQGGNTSDNGSSVLAQAGVRAEPVALVQTEQAQAEPVAWMNPETLDVIHDARKRAWENDFGMGGKAKAAGYTHRLVTPAQVPAAEVRAQALREAAKWLRNNYQDHATIDSLCKAILALAQSSTADKATEVRAKTEAQARAEFEAWAEPRGYSMERTTDSYKSQGTKSAWRGWWACERFAAPSTAVSGNTSALGEGADHA